MLQLKNHTSFAATMFLAPAPDGIENVFTVVKATFDLLSQKPTATQVPIVLSDEYTGDPGHSSIKTASDLALIKPGTDVLLQGRAWSPTRKPVTEAEVCLSVGPVHKTVHVTGDRVWQAGMLKASSSKPKPF